MGFALRVALLCLPGAAMAAGLALPPAIQNGFRIGGQPKTQGSGSIQGFTAQALAFDAAGDMYIAGDNLGGPFFAANQTILGQLGPAPGIYVMKISGAGQRIAYATLIGASEAVNFGGMAVDRDGHVFLAGSTAAPDFPTTSGSYRPASPQGGSFVLELDVLGQHMVYSTYLAPGSQATGIAIDDAGNAYVTGGARPDLFPTTPGAYQRTAAPQAAGVAFVTKLASDGKSLAFSTLLAGSQGGDYGSSIALGPGGAIHITGRASSADFPTTPDGNRSVATAGNPTVFLARFDNTGTRLLYSTLLYETQNAAAVAVDRQGNSYVAGQWLDIIVTKFNAAGDRVYTRTLAANAYDTANTILPLDDGTVLVGGSTNSPDFPTRDTLQSCLPEGNGVFLHLDPAGEILHSSLLAGTITAMALDPRGDLYLAGSTSSPDFPGTRELAPGASGWTFVFQLDETAIVRGHAAPACVVNGATYTRSPIAPGMIATIYGSNLGDTVTVDGTPSLVLYSADHQVNFVVPQPLGGNAADICVSESCLPVEVAPFSVGIFGVVNPDGTRNGPSNPALRGSTISILATGMGPSAPDGQLLFPVRVRFLDPTSRPCFFGSCPSPQGPFEGAVLYAGRSPGLPSGVTQVNVRIPEDAIPSLYVRFFLLITTPTDGYGNDASVAFQ